MVTAKEKARKKLLIGKKEEGNILMSLPYLVELAMRSYLIEYMSTYTIVASVSSELISVHKWRNASLNTPAAAL